MTDGAGNLAVNVRSITSSTYADIFPVEISDCDRVRVRLGLTRGHTSSTDYAAGTSTGRS